jgi:hypothetical protein
MKENQKYDEHLIWRHGRHCIVIINAILSLALLHYAGWLAYQVWQWIF